MTSSIASRTIALVSRYIKKFGRVGHSLGPSEERGFSMWVGYDIVGRSDDLTAYGFIHVDSWSEEKLVEHGITSFTPVDPSSYEKLGIPS
jgi:hypothetical protein